LVHFLRKIKSNEVFHIKFLCKKKKIMWKNKLKIKIDFRQFRQSTLQKCLKCIHTPKVYQHFWRFHHMYLGRRPGTCKFFSPKDHGFYGHKAGNIDPDKKPPNQWSHVIDSHWCPSSAWLHIAGSLFPKLWHFLFEILVLRCDLWTYIQNGSKQSKLKTFCCSSFEFQTKNYASVFRSHLQTSSRPRELYTKIHKHFPYTVIKTVFIYFCVWFSWSWGWLQMWPKHVT